MSERALQAGGGNAEIAEAIVAAYRARTPGSAAMFDRAARVLPGGTTGNLRHFQPYPLYFTGGSGSTMRDVDGHAYVDCFLCNGPLLLGHQPPAVAQALRKHAGMGSLVVNPPLAVDVAELLVETIPCAERVRFLNSGTEAVLTAVRLARAATGHDRIIKFFGHYHGQDDQFMVGLLPSATRFGNGVPTESVANTLLLPHGDAELLARTLREQSGIAAVLLDPSMHSGGLWGSAPEYLREVRRLTEEAGVALIFDEVITGFRLHLQGAQGRYGVVPDLATYAKALAAGEKLGAVAGKAKFMAGLDPNRASHVPWVFQSGTGNDGTGGLAAALAAVRTYRGLAQQGDYPKLESRAQRLAQGLRTTFRNRGIPFHANQLGPMLQLFLSDAEPGFATFSALDTRPLELFYLAMIGEGVLLSLPTSNHIYLSFAHTDEDITRILQAAAIVLDRHDFRALLRPS